MKHKLIAAIDEALAECGDLPAGVNSIAVHQGLCVYAHAGWHGIDNPRTSLMGKGATAAEAVADLQARLAAVEERDEDRAAARLTLVRNGLDPSLVSA